MERFKEAFNFVIGHSNFICVRLFDANPDRRISFSRIEKLLNWNNNDGCAIIYSKRLL